MAINFGVTEALARSDLLPGATPGAFAAVDADARTRHLQPSDVLVERGDVADEVFVVISGDLEVVLDSGVGGAACVHALGWSRRRGDRRAGR